MIWFFFGTLVFLWFLTLIVFAVGTVIHLIKQYSRVAAPQQIVHPIEES